MSDQQPTVVLVHGAWHGAWCWEPIVNRLARHDQPVVAVDLPGHGADPGPFGDLHDDADRVRQVLDIVGHPVVLVGHSYGGAVITEAGDHPAVEHLVYLCALALDAGETCGTAATDEAAEAGISDVGRPNLTAGVIDDGQGMFTVEPSVAAAALFNHCDAETVRWAVARLGPQPIATLVEPPSAVAWRQKPSTYVVCTEDFAIHPELQRILAGRCTQTVEWESDHSPFLSHPDWLAQLLAGMVEEMRPQR